MITVREGVKNTFYMSVKKRWGGPIILLIKSKKVGVSCFTVLKDAEYSKKKNTQ